ncbi:hypothetical protein RRG08_000857 [Elysia crispata]|uniref:DDE Tnp4 domain-containing protein n=1 Tax=Elysia crispata TaxID=231223 RepID=A0AAE0Z466_9GAST|nr:hypothetical protein RRG08_000857 [Elysia crispata]
MPVQTGRFQPRRLPRVSRWYRPYKAVCNATAAASLPLVSSIQGGLQRDVTTEVDSRTPGNVQCQDGFGGNSIRLVVTSLLEKTQTQTKKILDSSNPIPIFNQHPDEELLQPRRETRHNIKKVGSQLLLKGLEVVENVEMDESNAVAIFFKTIAASVWNDMGKIEASVPAGDDKGTCVENALDVLEPKPISTAETACYPHIIVRDEAFGIIENVMKPDSGKQLTYRTKIFNYELPRARKYIECTFDGIMANKWRMFHNLSMLTSTLPKT